jgi:hypothetical protein
MKEHGSSFRSKPYRYRAQNGSYVLLETEWSSFVNPWSKKLEFVIGQHQVLKVGFTNAGSYNNSVMNTSIMIAKILLLRSSLFWYVM